MGAAGDSGSQVGRSPWRRQWQHTPVFLLGKSHGQKGLAGYSPRGHKESDTNEWMRSHGRTFAKDTPQKNGRKIRELLLIPICYITLFEAHHYYLTWKNFTRRKPLLTSNTNMSVNIHISNYLKSELFPLVTLYIPWYIICILNKYKNYCELVTSLNDNNQSVSSNPGTTHPQSLNWS